MTTAYRYKCSQCDDWHEGFPDVVYDVPAYALSVPEAEKSKRLFLTSDLCVIDEQQFFIRCVMNVPIKGMNDIFGWDVWSSLSEANFLRYQEHFDEDMSNWSSTFGYLCNKLPEYPDTLSLKLNVLPQRQGQRPLLILKPTDHPLSIDQREGMSLERALKIAEPFLHND